MSTRYSPGLMQSLIGAGSALSGGAVSNSSILTGHQAAQMMNNAVKQARHSSAKKLFYGNVEVLQVANGYIVNIGTREGYEVETHIAATIGEVNEIIAAQIVAFRLEDKG